ncbi:MAG: hypothetical protein J0L75_03710 [Spirochaetes bacterium]|nr:hypothetical protein [Spirochaetota bacterium]
MSLISWTLTSESDVQDARRVIADLKANSTFDVLGLGLPLEAISNILFPGTSTLHTRFRYVVFVPAVFFAMRANRKANPQGRLRIAEADLIESLVNGGEKGGVIGRNLGLDLKYKPSMTYWSAIRTFGLFGGQSYMDRTSMLEQCEPRAVQREVDDVGSLPAEVEWDEDFGELVAPLFSDLEKLKWKNKLGFALTRAEAEFFRCRIERDFPDSLYVPLLKMNPNEIEKMESPFETIKKAKLPLKLKELLNESRKYSRVAKGIDLLYRWVLANYWGDKDRSKNTEWSQAVKVHRKRWGEWRQRVGSLLSWEPQSFIMACKPYPELGSLMVSNEGRSLLGFMGDCLECMRRRNSEATYIEMENLMVDRERNQRRNNSRFGNHDILLPAGIKKPGDAEQSDYYFDFRWDQGKRNVLDLLKRTGRS